MNRCAINRLGLRKPWVREKHAQYVEVAANAVTKAAPNGFNHFFLPPAGEYHAFRGGALPSALQQLGRQTERLLSLFCKITVYANRKCHGSQDWTSSLELDPEELEAEPVLRGVVSPLSLLRRLAMYTQRCIKYKVIYETVLIDTTLKTRDEV